MSYLQSPELKHKPYYKQQQVHITHRCIVYRCVCLITYSPGGLSMMCQTSPSMLAVPNLSTKVHTDIIHIQILLTVFSRWALTQWLIHHHFTIEYYSQWKINKYLLPGHLTRKTPKPNQPFWIALTLSQLDGPHRYSTPYTGNAMRLCVFQLSNGEVLMQFNDGSQLRLEPSGDTPIVFTDIDHTTARFGCSNPLHVSCDPYWHTHRYGYTSKLPGTVQHKLAKVPTIIATLAQNIS